MVFKHKLLTLCSAILILGIIGCSKQLPPNHCTSYEELESTLIRAITDNDLATLESLLYTEGVPADYVELNMSVFKWFSSFASDKDLKQYKIVRRPPIPSEINGVLKRSEKLFLKMEPRPTNFTKIYFTNNDDEGGLFSYFFYSGQIKGKWWCFIGREATSDEVSEYKLKEKTKAEQSLKQYPCNKDFGVKELFSLKRIADHSGNTNFSYPDVDKPVGSFEMVDTLKNIIDYADPYNAWLKGEENLPEGYYQIELLDLNTLGQDFFDKIMVAYKKNFNVNVEMKGAVWEGIELTIPSNLPNDISRPEQPDSYSSGTGGKGYMLRDSTFKEFKEWLENELLIPISISNPPEGRFWFNIRTSHNDNEVTKFWFEECGIDVKPKTFTKKTILISPKENQAKALK